MKRKDAARKEGTCPRDAPKDAKCANCRSKKGACLVAARIAAGNALPSPDEPSTSKPRTTQPAADSDMDDAEPRPSRERYRQICDIGEPGLVVCRHGSCHQSRCRHDHEDEVGRDGIDLDFKFKFARCKEEAHCGPRLPRMASAYNLCSGTTRTV